MRGVEALVVDDNRLNAELLRLFLERIGIRARVADNGALAMQMIRSTSFDLIVLDLRMPVMGGIELCREIRREQSLASPFVVAYTAHCMLEERARILAAGFNDLLIKPISFADVQDLCTRFGTDHHRGTK